jgi:O-antigen/teichoic acid export membrane protein
MEASSEVTPQQLTEGARGRNKRLLHSALSAVLNKGVVLLVNTISIPIMVRYLGAEDFGIWITLTTALSLLLALDLGISNTLTNFISEAFATDDRALASTYATTSFSIMAAFSLAIGGIAYIVWPHLNWFAIFHLSNVAMVPVVSHASAAALIVFLLGMPSSLVAKVLGGYQELKVVNSISALASVASLVIIAGLVSMKAGLIALVTGTCGSLVVVNYCGLIWLWSHHKPWLRPRPHHLDWNAARKLLSSGWHFFVLQLAGIVVFNTDNLIVTHYLGPAQVTPYSVTWRLVGYSAVLQTLLTPALWPAYSEAFVRGDLAWVRQTFRRISYLTMGSALAFTGILAVAGRPIIRLWAGQAAEPPQNLLLLMCVWIMISTYMNNTATILVAKGETRLQAWCSIAAAGLNLWWSIILVQRIGSMGVILGTILSYLLVLIGPQTWKTWTILKSSNKGQGIAPAASHDNAAG